MKILFCSPISLKETLGMARALLSIAAEFKKLDWEVKIISPDDIQFGNDSTEGLRKYLLQHATEYDVIEYDHSYLPYPRSDFSSNTLFVARSQLLAHHFNVIQIPSSQKLRFKLRNLLKAKSDLQNKQKNLYKAQKTLHEADLVVVLNQADREILIENKLPCDKIQVIPNGMSSHRRLLFNAVSPKLPLNPKIAFVGTFDYRKGATDFPGIVQEICDQAPGTTFLLVGTSGLFSSKEQVLAFFSKRLRDKIEVIPSFEPNDLPQILSNCSLGIFPSYIEGFPLGVLEMLAASLPVIAYDSPGAPMMLESQYLVPQGDVIRMAQRVVELLEDSTKLVAARIWAKERSQQFCWTQIAQQTSEIYLEHWQKKQIYL
jgi:glycosyltransferase involved in cell wall biosynthesis